VRCGTGNESVGAPAPLLWDDTKFPMKQIPQCGKKSVQALADAGLRSLDEVGRVTWASWTVRWISD